VSAPDTTRTFLLAKRPEGTPDRDTFELVERDCPEPGPGEVLVRTLYLSVDPYMRGRMRAGESYAEPWAVGDPLRGGVVGEVVGSNHPDFEAGDVAAGTLRWADHAVADGDDLRPVDPEVAPVSTALGVLGMPGRTAYFGMTDVAEPIPGDTVVVSGAAGAVGSVAGQIASLAGARVVGVAGTDEKTAFLTGDCGFDAAINYRTTDDYGAALGEVAPGGVDVYFDNVGGPIIDPSSTNSNGTPGSRSAGRSPTTTRSRPRPARGRSRSSSPPGPASRAFSSGTTPAATTGRPSGSAGGSGGARSPTARRSPGAWRTPRTRSSGCSRGRTSASSW